MIMGWTNCVFMEVFEGTAVTFVLLVNFCAEHRAGNATEIHQNGLFSDYCYSRCLHTQVQAGTC